MTPELQKYYENRFNIFSMDGWKDLIEDVDKIIASINNIATVSDEKDLQFKKGETFNSYLAENLERGQ